MNRLSICCRSRRTTSRTSAQGYTLIELLAGILITGVTTSISLGALMTFLRSEQFNTTVSTRLQDMNLALDLMADELRGANQFTVPPTCPSSEPSCIPVLEFTVAGVGQPIRYYLLNQADNSQSVFRDGVGFTPQGLYAAGTPFAALVIDRIPVDSAFTCPAGSQGAGTAAFNGCIRDGKLVNIQLQDQDGNGVNAQIARRVGL